MGDPIYRRLWPLGMLWCPSYENVWVSIIHTVVRATDERTIGLHPTSQKQHATNELSTGARLARVLLPMPPLYHSS